MQALMVNRALGEWPPSSTALIQNHFCSRPPTPVPVGA